MLNKASIAGVLIGLAVFTGPAAAFSTGCTLEIRMFTSAQMNHANIQADFASLCPDGSMQSPHCAALFEDLLMAEMDMMIAQFDYEICQNFVY